jgi:hypothetical protein
MPATSRGGGGGGGGGGNSSSHLPVSLPLTINKHKYYEQKSI